MGSTPARLLSRIGLLNAVRAEQGADIDVPFNQVRQTTAVVMTATLTAGNWAFVVATNAVYLAGELADGNTKTSDGRFQFRVPESWKPGQTIKIVVRTRLKAVTGTGVADNGSDIDVLAFVQSGITVGSDICLTAAQTYAAVDTTYDKEFTLDGPGVVPGAKINVHVVGRAIENDGGNGSLQSVLERVTVSIANPS